MVTRTNERVYQLVLLDKPVNGSYFSKEPSPPIFEARLPVPRADAQQILDGARIKLEVETAWMPSASKLILDIPYGTTPTYNDPLEIRRITYAIPVKLKKATLVDVKGNFLTDIASVAK